MNLRGWELPILLLLIVLLFGAKRLPDAARGVGRSLRIFKAETKGLVDSDEPGPNAALDQGRAPTEQVSGLDAPAPAPVHQETPKPPTSQA
ncbi:MAG: Sec-independent protein translocase subunit TatA [Candidatus Nanopelagicales bacterium]